MANDKQVTRLKYKGFLCIYRKLFTGTEKRWYVYTKDELSQDLPLDYLYPEMDCDSLEECKQFIDCY